MCIQKNPPFSFSRSAPGRGRKGEEGREGGMKEYWRKREAGKEGKCGKERGKEWWERKEGE